MEVSLHRLKLLRELQRRGTVTAAAQALNYTVSAVSQQLALLEREAGAQLLEKRGRGVVLTEAGVVLAEHADHILTAVDHAGHAMEAARSGVASALHVGVWASVASGLLPTGLALLAESFPGVEVRTRELAPEDTVGAVRDGTLDLSFVIDYSGYPMPWTPKLERRPVAVERMYAALPPGTVEGDQIALADLAHRQWILSGPRSHFGRAVRIACRDAGFDPWVVHEVGEQSTALAMVASGLGVTLVSDLGVRLLPTGVDLLPLSDGFTRTVSIAHRTRDADRVSISAFVDAVREAARLLDLGPAESASASETASPEGSAPGSQSEGT